MINFLISFILVVVPVTSDVKSFEGSIELVQESFYDISYFTYFVKNDNVRIDKFDNSHTLMQSLLINLDKKEIFVLSPTKNLYTKIEINNTQKSGEENYAILKTENSRMVGEHLCYQWRVKNKERNTEVAYWVSQKNFYFFEELLKLINSTDNTFEFFEKIPETQGFFPMLSVERTLLRREKSRLCVVNISDKPLNKNLFEIPANFELVRR